MTAYTVMHPCPVCDSLAFEIDVSTPSTGSSLMCKTMIDCTSCFSRTSVIDINKIKADAVREYAKSKEIVDCEALNYADKIERGES